MPIENDVNEIHELKMKYDPKYKKEKKHLPLHTMVTDIFPI